MVALNNKLTVLEVLRRRLRGQSRQHRRWLSESNTREMFFWPEAYDLIFLSHTQRTGLLGKLAG